MYAQEKELELFQSRLKQLKASKKEYFFEASELLKKEDPDPNRLDWLLLRACYNAHIDVFRLLIDLKKDLDTDDSLICSTNSYSVVQLLVAKGADVCARNNLPLQLAAARGDYTVAKFLILSGADPRAFDCLAFWIALERGHTSIARFLFNLGGVDLSVRASRAISSIIDAGYYFSLEFLLSKGVDVGQCAKFLPRIAEREQSGLLSTLVSFGVDVHFEEDEALIRAVFARNSLIVKILLDNGADVKAQNHKAIRIARKLRSERVLSLLLSQYKGTAYVWARLFVYGLVH
jgi:ankyrin repeat protein